MVTPSGEGRIEEPEQSFPGARRAARGVASRGAARTEEIRREEEADVPGQLVHREVAAQLPSRIGTLQDLTQHGARTRGLRPAWMRGEHGVPERVAQVGEGEQLLLGRREGGGEGRDDAGPGLERRLDLGADALLGDLSGEGQQEGLLGREVVEEGGATDAGALGDGLHRRVGEAGVPEQLTDRVEDPALRLLAAQRPQRDAFGPLIQRLSESRPPRPLLWVD